jgi:general secretion pathway protein D
MRAGAVVPLFAVLVGCASANKVAENAALRPDAVDPIRNRDLSARQPLGTDEPGSTNQQMRPMLFPGSGGDLSPASTPSNVAPADMRSASAPGDTRTASAAEPSAILKGEGVELNFDGADIRSVAKTLLGDIMQVNYVVDPRVQGNITLASVGPIPRKDVIPALESVLKMSNAAIVRDGSLVKIVPIPDSGGQGALSVGAGQPGFGVSVVPIHYISAATVAKTAENFLARQGSIRVDPSRNLLLVQGTTSEREAVLDVVSTFDVEWLRNQSVGVYPLKSTSPETMISELEKVFESQEGGLSQGVIRFQPIQRMNAVMVVTKNPKYLQQTTAWVDRLDRSDTNGTTLRSYRLKYGNAIQVAKVLNDIFTGRSGATDSPANQIAPGSTTAQSRLDSLTTTTGNRGSSGGVPGTTSGASQGMAKGGTIQASFDSFSDQQQKKNDGDLSPGGSVGAFGGSGKGMLPNVKITADAANNSIMVYSNQEDFRVVEKSLRELDRPRLQVAIEATVAEVTLTDNLQYGVQYFIQSQDLGLGRNKGSISMLPAAAAAAQSALISRVAPGFNFLLGSEQTPRLIIDALATVTNVKILSSPSVVAMDNQPALLEVGDEIPITTSSGTVLTGANTPVVNTIEMRNTGVILKVLPHVNQNGTVTLEVDQEISAVANPDVQTLTPTISQRRVHSTVAMVSGQTVLLGGLIQEKDNTTRAGIPGLRDIKILGDLLSNTNGTKTRSEIIIFIRPQLIRNSIDARNVTEEFRDRLDTMRSTRTIVTGADLEPHSDLPRRPGPVGTDLPTK